MSMFLASTTIQSSKTLSSITALVVVFQCANRRKLLLRAGAAVVRRWYDMVYGLAVWKQADCGKGSGIF
ncbi:hypothetical protein C5167_015443 [Papaver somniferum]|uniref:Uncharacterized protein n=1 Tax=Papaver somniferum TaxID=3469 RepID=A0A4Y7JAE9_PAPSO|nr:hypothetical protein C5167_015443 [Papaver somniferum]